MHTTSRITACRRYRCTRGTNPHFAFGKIRGPPTTPPPYFYEQHVQQVRPGAAQCSSIESCPCRVFTALRPPPTPHAPPHAPPSRSATGRLPTSGVLDRCHNGAPNSPASQQNGCLLAHFVDVLRTFGFFSLAPNSIPAFHRHQRHRRISLVSIATRVLEGKRRRVDFDRGCLP